MITYYFLWTDHFVVIAGIMVVTFVLQILNAFVVFNDEFYHSFITVSLCA